MKKMTPLLTLLLALLLLASAHAQKTAIYLDDIYIASEIPISANKMKKIEDFAQEIETAIRYELNTNTSTIVLDKQARINLTPVNLVSEKVFYDDNAQELVFGRIFYDNSGKKIQLYTYRYLINNKKIKTADREQTKIVSEVNINQIQKTENLNALARSIAKKLYNATTNPPPTTIPPPSAPQPDIKATPPAAKVNPPEPVVQQKQKKCSQTPAAVFMTAGLVMGGVGYYYRLKAENIYENEYEYGINNYDFTSEEAAAESLESARKPNQFAHKIAAGGILSGVVGAALWLRCRKKRKKAQRNNDVRLSSTIQRLQLEPQVQYNNYLQKNTYQAKLTFNF